MKNLSSLAEIEIHGICSFLSSIKSQEDLKGACLPWLIPYERKPCVHKPGIKTNPRKSCVSASEKPFLFHSKAFIPSFKPISFQSLYLSGGVSQEGNVCACVRVIHYSTSLNDQDYLVNQAFISFFKTRNKWPWNAPVIWPLHNCWPARKPGLRTLKAALASPWQMVSQVMGPGSVLPPSSSWDQEERAGTHWEVSGSGCRVATHRSWGDPTHVLSHL